MQARMEENVSLTLPPARPTGTRCWYAKLELSDEDRAQLAEWLADDSIESSRIAEALKAYRVSASQINNHRREHVLAQRPCR